ncbi:MAG: hypothetical protein IPG28_08715 [Betaproteobacteria bacterium]|nr:hypothetical protein [Betaproteobacteria bacterium]
MAVTGRRGHPGLQIVEPLRGFLADGNHRTSIRWQEFARCRCMAIGHCRDWRIESTLSTQTGHPPAEIDGCKAGIASWVVRAIVEPGDDTDFIPWSCAALPPLKARLGAASRSTTTEAARLHFADMAPQVPRREKIGMP